VYRLSILIPFAEASEVFEDTLASILQNRPTDCEIVVVHRGRYDDPYNLRDEVQFVESGSESDLLEMINHGIEEACGEIVHLVQSGVRVAEGWSDAAVARFLDQQVAAVSPVIVSGEHGQQVLSAGVCYTASGTRLLNGSGSLLGETRRLLRRKTVGPTLEAGFFRRSVLLALGGFASDAGVPLADVDLGLTIQALGLRCIVEPESVLERVVASESTSCSPSFRSGWQAERLFWQHAANSGWLSSLMMHPFSIAGEVLANWNRVGQYTNLIGRLLGLASILESRKQADRIRAAAAALASHITVNEAHEAVLDQESFRRAA
jgi:hypothetical protein